MCRPCWSTGPGPTHLRMSLTMTTVATPGAGQGAGRATSISQFPATPPSYSGERMMIVISLIIMLTSSPVRWAGGPCTGCWPETQGEKRKVEKKYPKKCKYKTLLQGVLLNETVPAWVVDIVVEKKLPKFIKVCQLSDLSE